MDARRAPRSRSRRAMQDVARMLVPVLLLAGAGAVRFVSPARAQTTALDSTATLLWTAPGDDGNAGRAARYEMRYRSSAIVSADTAAWWSSASIVSGMPAPGAPGTTDSVQVRGLAPHLTWYFVLRTADEVPNWSNFSNVAIRPPYVDLVPPASIADLGVASAAAERVAPPAAARPRRSTR